MNLIVDQPEVKLTHKWDNNQEDPVITGEPTQLTQGSFPEHPAQVTKKIAPLGPTGRLLQKATPPSLGVTAVLFNT